LPEDKQIDSIIVVMVTCDSEDEAQHIAGLLVEAHLAACVNIVPVRSIFEWDGKIEDQSERLLLIKSMKSRFDQLKDVVKANHSYDLPEIIALDIASSSSEYADWIRNICGGG
jgi:periplasmic divalent cation tolerance protein